MKKMAVIIFAIAFSFMGFDFVSARVVNNYFYTSLEIVNDKIEQEKTFDVNLNIKAHFDLKGVEGDLGFDNMKLELIGMDCNPEFTCLNNVRFIADKIDGLSGEYTLATFHFKIADDFDMENGDRIKFYNIEGANNVISSDTYVDIGKYIESVPDSDDDSGTSEKDQEVEKDVSDNVMDDEEEKIVDTESNSVKTPDTGENFGKDKSVLTPFMYVSGGITVLSSFVLIVLKKKRF